MNIMGNFDFSKPSKNFSIPFTPSSHLQSLPLQQELPKRGELMNEVFRVESYGLKTRQTMKDGYQRDRLWVLPKRLSLLTYNVWFQEHNSRHRFDEIMRIIEASNADVICLQEVNSTFLGVLHENGSKFGNKNTEYFMPQTTMHWYDTLILSRYPCTFYVKPFEDSFMSRRMLTAVYNFTDREQNPASLSVTCVHLESLNSEKQRISQLETIKKETQNIDFSLIAGDCNFSDDWNENKAVADFVDVWNNADIVPSKSKEMGNHTGFTMPPNQRFPPWRPDRIFFKNRKNSKWTPSEKHQIGIVGDYSIVPYEQDSIFSVCKDRCVRTPSDHFGLLASICLI